MTIVDIIDFKIFVWYYKIVFLKRYVNLNKYNINFIINKEGGNMFVGVIKVSLQIPMAQSLKDKRRIIKSLTEKCKNKYNVAVAEVDKKDLWKNSDLGLVTVAGDKMYLDKVINKVIKFIEEFPGIILYDYTIDYY